MQFPSFIAACYPHKAPVSQVLVCWAVSGFCQSCPSLPFQAGSCSWGAHGGWCPCMVSHYCTPQMEAVPCAVGSASPPAAPALSVVPGSALWARGCCSTPTQAVPARGQEGGCHPWKSNDNPVVAQRIRHCALTAWECFWWLRLPSQGVAGAHVLQTRASPTPSLSLLPARTRVLSLKSVILSGERHFKSHWWYGEWADPADPTLPASNSPPSSCECATVSKTSPEKSSALQKWSNEMVGLQNAGLLPCFKIF